MTIVHPKGINTVSTDEKDMIITSAFLSYHQILVGYIRKRTGLAEEAEDLAQEVYLRLVEASWAIIPGTVKSLMFTIAHNIMVDWMRRNASREKVQEYFFIHSPFSCDSTEESVNRNELERIEWRCIRDMPKRRAEVFLRYIYRCETSDDISRNLNLSKRTVEKHIFEARKELKKAFSRAI